MVFLLYIYIIYALSLFICPLFVHAWFFVVFIAVVVFVVLLISTTGKNLAPRKPARPPLIAIDLWWRLLLEEAPDRSPPDVHTVGVHTGARTRDTAPPCRLETRNRKYWPPVQYRRLKFRRWKTTVVFSVLSLYCLQENGTAQNKSAT